PVSIPISSILPAVAQNQAAPVQPPPVQMASVPIPEPVQMASAIYTPNNALPVPPPVPATHQYPMVASSAPPMPPPVPAPRSFSLIPPAMAEPAVQTVAFNSGHNSWGIQVGAYDSSSNAKAALGMAELTGANVLTRARPVVMTIHAGGGTKYRARFVGLQHDEAVNACSRLSGGPTGCVVLSPDAQS
ncbi:MAG: SPOR domain-containing protein, partial [Rhodospirillales bacterium]|nr:SPOR domain-containing protein [Rhodospirillales bacterium]